MGPTTKALVLAVGLAMCSQVRASCEHLIQGPTVTLPAAPSGIVWTGRDYAAVWVRLDRLYFTRINERGEFGEVIEFVVPTENTNSADIVWTGSRFGIVFSDYRWPGGQLYFMTLDRHGRLKVGPRELTHRDPKFSRPIGPRIAWNEHSYGVTWLDLNDDGHRSAFWAELDHQGRTIIPDTRVGGYDGTTTVIAASGSEFCIFFNTQEPDLNAQGGSATCPSLPIFSSASDLVGSQSGVAGVAISHFRLEYDSWIFFGKGPDVTVLVHDEDSTHIREPVAIGWDGSSYAVTWCHDQHPRLARVLPSGDRTIDDVTLDGPCGPSRLIWTGNGFGTFAGQTYQKLSCEDTPHPVAVSVEGN